MNNKILRTSALMVALVILPFIVNILPFMGTGWVRILGNTMLYVMLALGLNIVIGYAGLLDLGYIGFYAVGAYIYAWVSSPQLQSIGWMSSVPQWSIFVIIPLAAVMAGVAGALLGAPTLKLRGDYLAIVTLGFGEIIRIVMNNNPGGVTNGPQGILGIEPIHLPEIHLFGFRLSGGSLSSNWTLFEYTKSDGSIVSIGGNNVINHYLFFLAVATFVVLLISRLENSRAGRAWMALREDEIAAEAMGLNKRNVKLLAFGMGASFAGIAGALFASYQGFISPESFVLNESVMVLAMVVLGGMGSIRGVILGAVMLQVLPELLRYFLGWVQPKIIENVSFIPEDVVRSFLDPNTLRMFLFGLALVLVMRFRQEGLWPSVRRRQELHDNDESPFPSAHHLNQTAHAKISEDEPSNRANTGEGR